MMYLICPAQYISNYREIIGINRLLLFDRVISKLNEVFFELDRTFYSQSDILYKKFGLFFNFFRKIESFLLK